MLRLVLLALGVYFIVSVCVGLLVGRCMSGGTWPRVRR